MLVVCGWLFLLQVAVILLTLGQTATETVGDGLLARTMETGAANAVTAVVVSFRGFDTLGEVTVLFLAATGIGLLFSARPERTGTNTGPGSLDEGLAEGNPPVPTMAAPPPERVLSQPNEILANGIRLIYPVLLLFGVYVVVHGHLSPGGGFQGGVIIATAFMLRMLADPSFVLPPIVIAVLESFSGSGFVLFGLIGLVLAGTFLGNVLPHSAASTGLLVSAGVIPLIYILVGIKVGAEVGAIFQDMLEHHPHQEH
ncbi:sodium:proton antiporter [Thiocapsa imhoffii]|uniref:Sodium:proton antiporter n=2 Tax=Thiocapsa imhoffii TaxID=382777 RepID=A0A9X0WKX3_9GAMM|nr:hydrogen gas-evolving membrane-bound hydrogenase subunit E [Thiocapsa imhoffii]MBK1646305.1 sodium:proton antiporter [Thiocapsa imhoffii]